MADKKYEKYDWNALKKQFMAGDYKDVTDFITREQLKDNSNTRLRMKSWTEEKRKTYEKIVEKTTEKFIEKTAETNAKQLATINSIAEVLLDKISRATDNLDIEEQKAYKEKIVEYNAIGKLKREKSTIGKKNTVVELANALNIVANILSNGTETQENKIDKYFDQLNEVLDDGTE